MIKAVFCDLDGTLLNTSKSISLQNIRVIQQLKEHGIDFYLSTGRIFLSALSYWKQLNIATPIISCNGTYIQNPRDVNPIAEISIPTHIVVELIELLKNTNKAFHFYDKSTAFSNRLERSAWLYHVQNAAADYCGEKIQVIIDNDLKVHEYSDRSINKFIFFNSIQSEEEKLLQYLKDYSTLSVSSSSEDNVEIMGDNVSKGNAVAFFRKLHNLEKNEIMVIGDRLNDISMFYESDYSVAMSNGSDFIKKQASYVSSTNDDHGVAKAINKLVFGKGD